MFSCEKIVFKELKVINLSMTKNRFYKLFLELLTKEFIP